MNKKFYTFVALLATTFAGIAPVMAQQSGSEYDTVYMGAGYINEVYYSMSAGDKGTIDHKQWDSAFRANAMSASIITNDAANNDDISLAGVKLYTYPKADTNGWATVDTAGLSSWKLMVNSTTDWEDGAFCRNQKGHPDYGWCKYNSVTHNLTGDSLFIIQLRDGSLRKLWIIKKYSAANTFKFRFANIDGSDETNIVLDCSPYAAKNFIGYSIITKSVVDFEPVVSSKWDILFTRYMYTYPSTSAQAGTLYPFTGVLSNYKTGVKKYENVAPDFLMLEPQTMDESRSPIGADWKVYSGGYKVVDGLAYFVQDGAGIIYKLVFKDFVSSTGRIVLQKGLNSFTGVKENVISGFNAGVYPNPVNNVMNLVINPGKSRFAQVTLQDISGRVVFSTRYELPANILSSLKIPVSELRSGLYMVKIQNGVNVISQKVVVNN